MRRRIFCTPDAEEPSSTGGTPRTLHHVWVSHATRRARAKGLCSVRFQEVREELTSKNAPPYPNPSDASLSRLHQGAYSLARGLAIASEDRTRRLPRGMQCGEAIEFFYPNRSHRRECLVDLRADRNPITMDASAIAFADRPDSLRQIRACKSCKLLKTAAQFHASFCDNCTHEHPETNSAASRSEYVESRTTSDYDGIVSLLQLQGSWVATQLNMQLGDADSTPLKPGVYAISLPREDLYAAAEDEAADEEEDAEADESAGEDEDEAEPLPAIEAPAAAADMEDGDDVAGADGDESGESGDSGDDSGDEEEEA